MNEDRSSHRTEQVGRHPAAPKPPPAVLAAVDIGSNSIKMTVARRRPAAAGATALDEFAWSSETVRLGSGVEQTGRLADDRIDAALATLTRFAVEARGHAADAILAVATEATRAAANGRDFLDRVRRDTGIDVRVLSGDEEAALTFRGLAASTDVTGDVIAADIGGGSTELIVATDGTVRGARSFALGSGRLSERLVQADPPPPTELAACRRAAAEILSAPSSALPAPTGTALRLVVVGGTGQYLARLVPDEHNIAPAAIDHVLARLVDIPAAALALHLDVAEARARVLPAGIAIVAALADLFHPSRIEVARSGIRTGLLLDAFDRAGSPPPAPAPSPPENVR